MNNTLNDLLVKHNLPEICEEAYFFAKDLTLNEFFEKCQRGDWILWVYSKYYDDPRSENRAKAEALSLILHLLQDERSFDCYEAVKQYADFEISTKDLEKACSYANYYADTTNLGGKYALAAAAVGAEPWLAIRYITSALFVSQSDFRRNREYYHEKMANLCRRVLDLITPRLDLSGIREANAFEFFRQRMELADRGSVDIRNYDDLEQSFIENGITQEQINNLIKQL